MLKKHYDIIFIGGGCASRSLLYRLKDSDFIHSDILVLEPADKSKNDRTWSFWASEATPFDHIVFRSWDKLKFIHPKSELNLDMTPFNYRMIRGVDFYQETDRAFTEFPNLVFSKTAALGIHEKETCAEVYLEDGKRITANYVFDSRIDSNIVSRASKESVFLWQHFGGCFIRTQEPVFDPERFTMFDFRPEQHGEVRFIYTLPFSPNEALVEFTIFSSKTFPHVRYYEKELKNYFQTYLPNLNFEVTETEFGKIPMTDFLFQKKSGKRVFNIGTRSGMAKASTGYAFLRIQRQTDQIAKALINTGVPDYQAPHSRFAVYDAMILRIMAEKGESIRDIFLDLFTKNSTSLILSFLDERTSFGNELKVMSSVPPLPFLKTLTQFNLLRYFF